MLQLLRTPPGPALLTAPALTSLGVIHAFSTRVGGVSAGAFASLNLDWPGQARTATPGGVIVTGLGDRADADLPANLSENYRRLHQALGAEGFQRAWVRQVHGNRVVTVGSQTPPRQGGEAQAAGLVAAEAVPPSAAEAEEQVAAADALVTDQPGILLSIRVADCLPILLAAGGVMGTGNRRGLVVAAVHAGWRGIIAGVLPATLTVLRQRHRISPADLHAVIGPAIGVEHFEVGPEVSDAFVEVGLNDCVRRDLGEKPHVDLAQAAALQLRRLGVPLAAIDRAGLCTYREGNAFFSHRREQGLTGRMAAVIGIA